MLSKLLEDAELGLIGVQQSLGVAESQKELVEDRLDELSCRLIHVLLGHWIVPLVPPDAVHQFLTVEEEILVIHLFTDLTG